MLTAAPGRMAKTQKTLYLPDEIVSLVQQYADKTGVSFTRVLVAATLQFFFQDHQYAPNTDWITQAVLLEKEISKLDEIPVRFRRDLAAKYRSEIAARKRVEASRGERPNPQSVLEDNAKYFESVARSMELHIEELGGAIQYVLHQPPQSTRWIVDRGEEGEPSQQS